MYRGWRYSTVYFTLGYRQVPSNMSHLNEKHMFDNYVTLRYVPYLTVPHRTFYLACRQVPSNLLCRLVAPDGAFRRPRLPYYSCWMSHNVIALATLITKHQLWQLGDGSLICSCGRAENSSWTLFSDHELLDPVPGTSSNTRPRATAIRTHITAPLRAKTKRLRLAAHFRTSQTLAFS